MTRQTLNNNLPCGVAAALGITAGFGAGIGLCLWLTAIMGLTAAGMIGALLGACIGFIAYGFLLDATWGQARNLGVALTTVACALALAIYLSGLVGGFLAGFLFSAVAAVLGAVVGIAVAVALCVIVFVVCLT